MSLRQAKRATQATQEFGAAAGADGSDFFIFRIAQTLRNRFLGEKHFQELFERFQHLQRSNIITIETQPIAYNPETTLAKRRLSMSSMHMGFHLNHKDPSRVEHYIPCTLEANITYNTLDYRMRLLPVLICSKHVEERFEYWKRSEIEYSSPDFKRAMTLGLIMTFGAEKLLLERNLSAMPIAIPYAGGLFLGKIRTNQNRDLYHMPAVCVHRDAAKNIMTACEGLNGAPPPYWQPCSLIELKTHVSKTLNPHQKALMAALDKLTESELGKKALSVAVPIYGSVRPTQSQDDIKALHSFVGEIEALARSPIWENAHANSWKHIEPGHTPVLRRA